MDTMTPARYEPPYDEPEEEFYEEDYEEFYDELDENPGCMPVFLIPPLAALGVGLLLAYLALQLSAPGQLTPASAANAMTVTGNGMIAPLFTPEIQFWSGNLGRWAAQAGVDANLAATVMQIESCGYQDARSSVGATGLFQVMPFHFLPYENAYDPDTNALRGLNYLRRSLDAAGGNARLALAGYNGGIGVIARSESNWPAETIRYVYWGSGIYADAQQNASQSARLDEWLARSGGLCPKARQRQGSP
jgi:hypothetical protein